jgi:hypothetical protein
MKTETPKVDQRTQALWAADCAERVLPYFESERPRDERPRLAIAAARAWSHGEISVGGARKSAFASHAAAREASNPAAVAAARAAGHAAATAHVATHAPHAVEYARKAIAPADPASIDIERM